MRLTRVGQLDVNGAPESQPDVGIVALGGPNVWVWQNGAFRSLDLREW